MASTRWTCIIAISLLLSLGMSVAQRSLLMSSAEAQVVGEPTDFELHGGTAGSSGSSSEGGTTKASSDIGSLGQDMPGKAALDHRDLSKANNNGWDMDPGDEDCGDQTPDPHYNPNEPEPIPRFPGDPDRTYGPPLNQWQDQFMYCTPMSCQGMKEDYAPKTGGDCMGFSMLIEYPPPPPLARPRVNKNLVHLPNEANPDGHKVPPGEPAAFPPES